jgi:tetratricopeptide (TPR) repeat protein
MTGASNSKRDFFISFNQADRAWATWIAWVLEEAGYSVFFQDWDFRRNFVEHMDEAHRRSAWTIAVLSDNYFGSKFTLLEWSARIAREPERLIPVRVGALSENHILDAMLYADLTTRDEAVAEQHLLGHIRKWIDPAHRSKPKSRPGFPGAPARLVSQKPRFPVASHNLPPSNPDFVGREEVLAELHRQLTSGQGPAVINQTIMGLGGIGKTQTVLAYAYRHLADYRLVWWLRAESAATLAADYTALAEPLGLDPTTAEQYKLLREISRALQATDGWLLILDNVEDPKLPRTYLPTTGSGHVLITSRRTDWHGIAKTLPLEVMDEAEALQLLTGQHDPEVLPLAELAEAKVLASDLGCLPLALAQARAYMLETGRSLASYHKLLQDTRPRVLNQKIRDYPETVAKTWQISIKATAHEHPAAQPLLELLAFFAADALPVEVLAAKPATLPKGLRTIVWLFLKVLEIFTSNAIVHDMVLAAEPVKLPKGLRDEFDRDKAIGALHRFSLIHAQDGTITVHRLVQAVTHDGLDAATAKTRAALAVRLVQAALPDRPQDPTNWPTVGALLPHALAVAEVAERLGAGLGPAAAVLNQTGLYHVARAAYVEAEPLFQRALAIREKVLGAEYPDTAGSLNNLAELYRDQGRLSDAEPLHQRALATYEKVLGTEHSLTATTFNNLALLYQAQGRLAEAEPLLQRALAIAEKALGPEHPQTHKVRENLATLRQRLSDFLPDSQPMATGPPGTAP